MLLNIYVPPKVNLSPTVTMATRKWPWLLVGSLGAIAIAAGVFVYSQRTPASKSLNLEKLTTPVVKQDLNVTIKANGVVQAIKRSNLSPKEAGRIAKLYVEEGDRVEAGQLIAVMESEQATAQVNQYRANLERAQAGLLKRQVGNRQEDIAEAEARVTTAQAMVQEAEAALGRASEERQRYELVAKEGAISQNSLNELIAKEKQAQAALEARLSQLTEQQTARDRAANGTRPEDIAQAEAEVSQAVAQLQAAENQLGNAEIRAPFAGVITRKYAQDGDIVAPTTFAAAGEGTNSTSIVELSSGLEVEAKVPEGNMAQIKPDLPVEVRIDAYPNDVFKGRVRLIAPRAVKEENVTSLRVKVSLETGQDRLKAGVNVRLNFLASETTQALVIPSVAVIPQKDGQLAVLIPDATRGSKLQPIKVGLTVESNTQILEGLREGDRVFTQPPPDQKIDGIDNTNGLF